jgi:hypothetical protein
MVHLQFLQCVVLANQPTGRGGQWHGVVLNSIRRFSLRCSVLFGFSNGLFTQFDSVNAQQAIQQASRAASLAGVVLLWVLV